MFEYRVTKYDPALRDSHDAYVGDDWTSVSDLGQAFRGSILTGEEYQRLEDAYVEAALAFMREGGVPSLSVVELEGHGDPLPFGDGQVLAPDEVGDVVRQVLREEFWCRLEGAGGFIHFGYDYYMYVGVSHACPEARALAGRLGLFVEEFNSPYSEHQRQ